MRRSTLFALVGIAAVTGLAASGFPRRIGLTASQAAVSLPGDLLIPDADVVVDRGIEIAAPASRVWEVLDAAFESEDADRLVAREEEDYIILRVPTPGLADEDETPGTCVLALLPITDDRTVLHMRERHRSCEDAPRSALRVGLALESFSSMSMLRDIRTAAQALR